MSGTGMSDPPPIAASASGARMSAREVAVLLQRPEPTAEQQAVIEAPLEPGLVVAGAGSGKTETMASRVVWLVANGLVEPDGVLGLTFTRKAAGELAERIRRRLRQLRQKNIIPSGTGDLGLGDVNVSTYNSYSGSLVKDHGIRIAVEPGASILGEAGRWQLAAEVVEAAGAEELGFVEKSFGGVVDGVLQLASACAEHLREPEEILEVHRALREHAAGLPRDEKALRAALESGAKNSSAPAQPFAQVKTVLEDLAVTAALVRLVRRFLDLKRQRGLLDFGDQVRLAARLAVEVPEVRAEERSRWDVVLLDEYQDTSVSQLVLLSRLFDGGHPVTAVGDPHQSIYGWRGASAGNLARFGRDFPRTGGETSPVRYLTTSWRNDARILLAANTIAAPLLAPGGDHRELRPGPMAAEGDIEVVVADPESAGDRPDTAALVDWVRSQRQGRPGGTVAVLCRRRSQFPGIEGALRLAGLPVEVVGLGGLLDTPEILDLVSTLQVVHDPDRGDALMRLLTGSRWKFGAGDIAALAGWSREQHRRAHPAPANGAEPVDRFSLADGLDDLPPAEWRRAGRPGPAFTLDGHTRMRRLAAMLRDLRRKSSYALPDLVRETERALLLDVEVLARPGSSPMAARAHLDTFVEIAAEFAGSSASASLVAFLGWLEAARNEERGLQPPLVEPDPAAVQLLTVHASKGLEWDAVAIPDLVEGVFPGAGKSTAGWLQTGQLPAVLRGDADGLPEWHWDRTEHQAGLRDALAEYRDANVAHHHAEERRLAYVAVTRARSALWLGASHWGTGAKPREVSRFLRELVDAGVVDEQGWAPQPEEGAANPSADQQAEAPWPVPAAGDRAEGLRALAAEMVERALRSAEAASAGEIAAAGEDEGGETSATEPFPGASAVDRHNDRLVGLLLEERARLALRSPAVGFPDRVSPTRLVAIDRDPVAAAAAIARPMPRPPSEAARLGTAFHAWLEQRFGQAALLDLEDAADSGRSPSGARTAEAAAAALARLKDTFLASRFADMTPVAVEQVFELRLGDLTVPGKIDAVFRAPGGGLEVVDWKTGAAPGESEREHTVLQLALYRLAVSEQSGLPPEDITAVFYYLGDDREVRYDRLPDRDQLIERFRSYYRSAPGQHPPEPAST